MREYIEALSVDVHRYVCEDCGEVIEGDLLLDECGCGGRYVTAYPCMNYYYNEKQQCRVACGGWKPQGELMCKACKDEAIYRFRKHMKTYSRREIDIIDAAIEGVWLADWLED